MEKSFKIMYDIIQRQFTKLVNVLRKYMIKVLKIKDFKWIKINRKKETGYYSFKKNELEIAIDEDIIRGWTVYFCNKFEEVLEEYGCRHKKEALIIANKIYNSSVI